MLYTLNTHPKAQMCFVLWPTIFDIQGDWKLAMHRMTHNDLKNLTVKNALYTLDIHPWGPNFTRFWSMTSNFRDMEGRLSKIAMHPMTQNDLNHLTVKSAVYTLKN